MALDFDTRFFLISSSECMQGGILLNGTFAYCFSMFYAYSLKIVDLPKGMNEGCVLEGVLYRKR